MPICYGNSGGVGRFIKRVEQPVPEGNSPRKIPRNVKKAVTATTSNAMVMCADENRVYGSIRDADFASITTTPLSTRSSTSRNGTAITAATRSTPRSGRIARSAEPRGSSDEEG